MVGSGGQLGQPMLMELNCPFLPGTLSEDLVPIDAKELTCSTGRFYLIEISLLLTSHEPCERRNCVLFV